MKFTREFSSSLTVLSVSDGTITIGQDTYEHTIAMTLETVIESWPVKRIADLVEDDFAALLEEQPEVIVLGTGAKSTIPPRDLMFAMARRGIGFEVMDTRAAARTFNILAGEDRRVVAVFYVT